jgi:hypothetical protein
MQHKHRLPLSHRAAAEQFDLFGPPGTTQPPPGLEWQQLPQEARETVTRLMARLLVDHESGDCRPPGSAGGRRDV